MEEVCFTAWEAPAMQTGECFKFKITQRCSLLNLLSSLPVQGSRRAVLGEQLLSALVAAELFAGATSAVAVQSSFWGAPAEGSKYLTAHFSWFSAVGRVGGRKDMAFPHGVA